MAAVRSSVGSVRISGQRKPQYKQWGINGGGLLADHLNTKFQEHPELQISANLMLK